MATLTSYILLLSATAVLSFRLTGSYQLSFVTLACSHFFIGSIFSSTSTSLAAIICTALVVGVSFILPIHKITERLLAKRAIDLPIYPIIFAATLFASSIIATLAIHIEPGKSHYHSLLGVSGMQWLMMGGSLLAALNIFYNRHTRPTIIMGSSLLVSTALYSLLLQQPYSGQSLLSLAAPWAWLILMRASCYTRYISRWLLAATIAVAPLLQLLLSPSHLCIVGLPIIVAATVCLADILHCANTPSMLIPCIPTTACLAAACALGVQLSFL